MAFREAGAELEFTGQGVDEKGIVSAVLHPESHFKTGQEVIAVDTRYFRPAEVDLLIGDATKAKEKLGWVASCPLSDLVQEMVQSDLRTFQREEYLKQGGFMIKNQYE